MSTWASPLRQGNTVSHWLVLFEETFELFQVEAVHHIGLPLESGLEENVLSPASAPSEVLVFHIVVAQTGQLSELPAEVSLIPTHVDASEEEEAVSDEGELVDVPHLHWVLSLDHIETKVVPKIIFINY